MKILTAILFIAVSANAYAGTFRAVICNPNSQLIKDINESRARSPSLIHDAASLASGKYPIQSKRLTDLTNLLRDSSTQVHDHGYGAAILLGSIPEFGAIVEPGAGDCINFTSGGMAWDAMRDGRNAEDK